MAATQQTYLHRDRGIAKVKSGFSWPAFFFGSLWAAAHRMWVPEFLLLLLIDVALWFLTGVAEAKRNLGLALAGLLATVAYAVIRGRFGNRWLAASLVRRNYTVHSVRDAGL
jgi:Protein of unknown function (DUF2628)